MKIKSLYVLILALFMAGCGQSPKIVIPSYTAPKEVSKLSKIKTKDEFISKGAYLAVWINPDVLNANKTNPKLKNFFIQNIKAKITQTNFIALDPLGSDDGVALTVNILDYKFTKQKNSEKLFLEASFTLSRGADEFLVKTYKTKKIRSSKNPSMLPSEDHLASDAAKELVKYFISDISPLKTYQTREFKPLPDQLKFVLEYAKRKNYDGAIKAMRKYEVTHKDNVDKDFYYNLAILYEAKASQSEDLRELAFANRYYELSFQKGGYEDKTITKAKARFDNFYRLLKQVKQQEEENKALIEDRNSLTGSSDDEYE